jgi:D-alanyl-lipoteichoic acid acyltransferase DltB (MBOAT superfamily)
MSALLFSESAIVALAYFALATAVARLMEVGVTRSVVFALLNIAAVWLVFFGRTQSGVLAMSLYVFVLFTFWLLIRKFNTTSTYIFWFGFLPPILLLVFVKTSGLLTVVGLSYMMFRCAHISWELQHGKIKLMSLPDFMAHNFFMPTFLLGPISPYSYFENSFNVRENCNRFNVFECLLRILKGMVKIIVIVGVFMQLSPESYLGDYRMHSFYELIIAALGFYIFLYANFSGLNDVSIGAAGLMGIAVKENFDRPYFAQSITELYKRWHISLSEWFRDIVFAPLAASLMRRATWLPREHALAVALMTTFVLIGWWHGDGWQFWLIGFLLGSAVVFEFYAGRWVKRQPKIQRLAPPPTVARLTRMLITNLYFAMVTSLISIDWKQHGLRFADLIKMLRGLLRWDLPTSFAGHYTYLAIWLLLGLALLAYGVWRKSNPSSTVPSTK